MEERLKIKIIKLVDKEGEYKGVREEERGKEEEIER